MPFARKDIKASRRLYTLKGADANLFTFSNLAKDISQTEDLSEEADFLQFYEPPLKLYVKGAKILRSSLVCHDRQRI